MANLRLHQVVILKIIIQILLKREILTIYYTAQIMDIQKLDYKKIIIFY